MNRCKVGGTRVCLAAGDGLSWVCRPAAARIIPLKIRPFTLNNVPMTKGMKMKRPMAVFLAIVALAGPGRAEEKKEIKDKRTKISYANGFNKGRQLEKQKNDPDIKPSL